MEYRQVQVISGKGPKPDQFTESLNGIGLDRAGLLYAVGDREVKVFNTQGALTNRWETEKPPYCVAIRGDLAVFVGEAGQVEIFDSTGKRRDVWRDVDRLTTVTAIGFWGDNVIVADAGDRCIRRYDAGGRWINNIGKDNNTKGFLIPNGYLDFDVDGEGVIHAANPAKHRVERYTMTGELLGKFGRFGTKRPENFPGCCNPTNLALTGDGGIVVTEKAGPRMKVFDSARELRTFVGSDAFDAGCKNMDVAVDAKGRIYVVDTVKLSILVFAPDKVEGDPEEAADGPREKAAKP